MQGLNVPSLIVVRWLINQGMLLKRRRLPLPRCLASRTMLFGGPGGEVVL